MAIETRSTAAASAAPGTAVAVLAVISICHMLNDVIQSLIVAIYPMIKSAFQLDFRQIGLITFTFQLHRVAAAAGGRLLSPTVTPRPIRSCSAWRSSLLGLLLLAFASSYGWCCSPPG